MADSNVMSYVQQVMQTELAAVRLNLGHEQENLTASQTALAASQTKIMDLKSKEAELVSHLKANGWPEVAAV